MKRIFILALLIGCGGGDDGGQPAPDPRWDTDSLEAVELQAHPTVPPELQVPLAQGPTVTPPAPTASACTAAAEVPCDGVDQDCDHTDLCDTDGDGLLEVQLIPDVQGATAPLTSE